MIIYQTCGFEKFVEELSNRRGLGGKLIQETVFFLLHLCIQPLNEFIFRTKHSLPDPNQREALAVHQGVSAASGDPHEHGDVICAEDHGHFFES